MLSVKQGSSKYHFKSIWYDATLDWTQVFQTIIEHSTHLVNELDIIIIIIIIIINNNNDNRIQGFKTNKNKGKE